MYAIIEALGHQYRVQPGQFLRIAHMDQPVGFQWTCETVLAIQDSKGHLFTGQPFLKKARVLLQICRHGRSKKILVFKKRRRKSHRVTKGHRQDFTEIYVESLLTPRGEILKKGEK